MGILALEQTGANPHLILELRDYAKIPKAFEWLTGQGLVQ